MAPDATPQQIRAAYRRLARTYHPDVGDAGGGETEMSAINDAWFVLSDSNRRTRYDRDLFAVREPHPVQPPPAPQPDLPVVEARALRLLFGATVLLFALIALVFLLIAFTEGH